MKRLVGVLLLGIALTGCTSSQLKKAYNVEAGLVAAYKVAAPMRAELCDRSMPVMSQPVCETSLKALKADYVLIQEYSRILAAYLDSKDEKLRLQLVSLIPVAQQTTMEILDLISQLKAAR